MIGTWTVVGIRHLTHNQVVAGSSPAGPGWLTQWVNHSKGRGLHIIKDRLTIMNAVNSITEEDGNIIDEIHFAYENPSP